jgi:hypothetical protein
MANIENNLLSIAVAGRTDIRIQLGDAKFTENL